MPLISPTTELDNTLRRFARQAQSLTMAGGAAIALASLEDSEGMDSGDEMTFRASTGDDAPGVGASLRMSAGFAEECFREGKPLRCDDSETDSRVDRDRCRKLGVRSMVAVPLKNNGSVLGIIEIFSPRTRAFTESHMAKLRVLAERVTVAVEGANDPAPTEPESAPPDLLWADVFVNSSLPWKQLLQSAVCHVLVIAAVWNITLNWVKSEKILQPAMTHSSQVTYYPSHPSFPAAQSRPPASSAAAKVEVQSGKTAAMVVKAAADRQVISPPAVKVSPRGGVDLAGGNPAMPVVAVGAAPRTNLATGGGPGMGQVSIVAPAPQAGETLGRAGTVAFNSSIVAPSPSIGGSVRSTAGAGVGHSVVVGPAPGLPLHDGPVGSGISMGGGDAVVGPAPAMPSSARSSVILSAGLGGDLGGSGTVVGPAPGLPSHDGPIGAGMVGAGTSMAMGGSGSVVGPAPGMPSRGGSRIMGTGLGGSGSVVGPAPVMPSREGSGYLSAGLGGSGTVVGPPPEMALGGRGVSSAGPGGLGTSVVPPAATVGGSSGVGAGQDGSGAGSGLGLGSSVAAPPASIASADIHTGNPRQAAPIIRTAVAPQPPAPLDDPAGRIIPDLPVRVLGIALTLPSSSFFSNYEVFLAERQNAQNVSQIIKLVFESRPTQRRLSEYGVKDSRIVKLRVKRDPTCDETAAQVTGVHLPELLNASPDAALHSTDANTVLPCYRTTADDYQKMLSKKR